MQRTSNKFSPSPFARYYRNNAVIQLIMVLGSAFVIFHFTIAIMRIMGYSEREILGSVVGYSTLPALAEFKWKVWELFTYGLFHMKQGMIKDGVLAPELGFWAMFSNMLWLYCFGSVVQMLIGYRHVMPLFFYAIVVGGITYLLAQFIPGLEMMPGRFMGGAQAGVTGLAVAALVIAPKYRFYLTPYFSIPLYVVGAIFGVLMFLYSGMEGAPLFLAAGGGVTGFLYITLLRRGANPGEWLYSLFNSIGSSVTPKEDAYKKHSYRGNEVLQGSHASASVQQRVDEILDKINRKGYNSLTQEEKDILLKASKDND